jgi:hypothetical protein
MKFTLRSHISYANLTATLALFIALGGGAYAATLPRNSVGAKQLKASAVERIKIKKNAINDAKVQDESLTGTDIREGTLGKVPAAAAADSAVNAGHANSSAALDKVTFKSAPGSAEASTVVGVTVPCDAGQRAISGGAQSTDPARAYIVDSFPQPGGAAWTARVANPADPGGAAQTFTVYAICTPVGVAG